jgi:exodeoxyribonuclease VII large subunit
VEQIALEWEPRRKFITVSEFTDLLRGILDDQFGDFWLSGEISGSKLSSAGHYYFTLKDERAQIRCACFRGAARYLKFKPQDGVAVLARGRVDLYAERGDLQFIVDALEPQGHGALQLAFEQLKKKLAAEGLFQQERKRALPKLPQRIGIVTSPTGSVVRDMLNVMRRRFPGLHIRIFPALVQGEGSVEAVCRGLEYFARSRWAEVVIIARGGGSLEDLWTFNEEAVARLIAASPVPVISAIGHETDFTIADFVADLRAPTPSAAAELVICTREQILDQIAGCRRRLEQLVRFRLAQAGRRLHQQGIERAAALLHRGLARRSQKLDDLDYRLRQLDVRVRLGKARQRIDQARGAMEQLLRLRLARASQRLAALDRRLHQQDLRSSIARARHRLEKAERSIEQCVRMRIARADGRLAPLSAHLTQLSPLRILERGYAIVENEAGTLVKRPADAPPGSSISVRLADGRLKASVTAATPGDSSELPS